LEKEFAPVFTAEDLVNLGSYQIYLKLMIDGIGSQPFSARTLPSIIEKPQTRLTLLRLPHQQSVLHLKHSLVLQHRQRRRSRPQRNSERYSMASKRILIFSLAYYPLVGGAEVAVKEITDRLRDIEFDMVTRRFDESHLPFEMIGRVHVHRVAGSKNMFPFKAFMLARKLDKRRKYTHIWAIMANWAGFAALFYKYFFPRVRYVLTLQEGDPLKYIEKKVLFVYPLWKQIFRKADVVQAISRFLGRWAKDKGYKGRVDVIPNGVNVKSFSGRKKVRKDFDVVLITTSRLVEKNGIGDVIEALRYMPENVKFNILGTGPLEESLKQKVVSLGLDTRVKFLGFVDQSEIPKHLHESDIFIRPSLSEGMGNSFIEAMAAGLPVIATEVGGIPDFLFDPDRNPHKPPTGLYVDVHDPRGIAKQVERLMKDVNLRETIVSNGKRLAKESYDWDLIAKEMERKVFDRVANIVI
jgi:glycosyltransferase involved in cell wall biosynthesis